MNVRRVGGSAWVRRGATALTVGLVAAGSVARGATYDLYIYSYCPPSPAFCGAQGVSTAQQYRDYIESAVEEINRQWQVNGISFRPQVQDIEDNPFAARAWCGDDPATPFDETLLLNAWRANVAQQHPKAISIILQNKDSDGLCCSQLPINNDPDPEELFGVRCNVRSRYKLGSVLAHELGHHFCLCHTHGWKEVTNSFMDTAGPLTLNDGPLDWDGDNLDFCGVFDTDADPGFQEIAYDAAGAVVNPQPIGMDVDATLAPVDGHEWCAEFVNKDPALIDDWSPHQQFCSLTCIQYQNGQAGSFLTGQTGTTARNAMSYWNDACRGPYVVGGQKHESFTPNQKSRIEFCRQTYRGAGTENPLQDVCAGANGGDSDHDGICQAQDNCKFDKNTSQTNRDGDALGDECDPVPNLPNAKIGLLQHDDDADGCPDLEDQHPTSSHRVIGSGFSSGCGYGKVPTYGFEGKDSDNDGLLDCEDYDDDNDGLCDEGGPLPGGSIGVPPGGCAPGPGGSDECPTSGPGAGCHIAGAGIPCPQEWLVCLGGGCVEYFVKLVEIGDPDPAGGIVFEDFQIFGDRLYLARPSEMTVPEMARALQGASGGGFAAGAAAAPAAGGAGFTPAQGSGLFRLEIWSRRDNQPVAVVAEYESIHTFFDATARGAFLAVTPGQDAFGNASLDMRATFAPGILADDPPRDTDADGWPDWLDNCILEPNRRQTDADGDGFGNVCDPDLDDDRMVSQGDVEAIRSCDGADLNARLPLAEPAWLQGVALGPFDHDAVEYGDLCAATDLDDSGRVDLVDSRLAEGRIGQAPGPSALESSQNLCGSPGTCDDGDPCTVDRCYPTTGDCLHEPLCDDDNACTADTCDPATGDCGHAPAVCDDGNVCTVDTCRPSDGACLFEPTPEPLPCDDGDACTRGDACAGGVCHGEAAWFCDDGDPCTINACDPANGECIFPSGACDDGNPCTAETCDSRIGCGHTPLPDGTGCEDGDLCTIGDACLSGTCFAGPGPACDDGDLCTSDSCDPDGGACLNVPSICDDGLLDTIDACEPGTGMCLFTPIVPEEAMPVRFDDSRTLSWPETAGATHWNTYRGTIPSRMMGSRPAGSEYDEVCFEAADLAGNGATRSADGAVPPAGEAFYFVVTGKNSVLEGPAGTDPSGTPRFPPSPCLAPH